ncbi:MAG TPA: cellulose binding domain-containing protein [Actinocrinis sp.]|jgi:hypothetical protein
MKLRSRLGRPALAAAAAAALAVPMLLPAAGRAATTEALSVNLASTRGPSTEIGEGFLYGISQDGTQPSDQYLEPLNINAFRGGGHASSGWIGDGYSAGSGTQADITEVINQAKRLTQAPYHAQYQVILSDVYGADGSQPSNTTYPCDSGNCSNWVSFIDAAVGALQNSGLKFAYDIWNEPDISLFWTRGADSTQYFQMWDTAVQEIHRIAPGAQIVGPDFASTPQQNSGEWNTWLAHTRSADTLPNMITNHDEGDGDDPVTVAQAIDSAQSANGISPTIPLSANEYQPQDQQTAGVTAWYLARFAQSGYTNALRGNWNCCEIPNLTGILTEVNGTWEPTGNWWAMRDYADMTGTLVNTSGEVGSTAISASEDSTAKRAVAIIGDENGYTGAASVTFSGLSSLSWLAAGGSVTVTVDRIPDQSPLSAPQVVFDQTLSASSGSVTAPFTFQAAHDAFAVYVTPAGSTTPPGNTVSVAGPGNQTGTVGTAIPALQIHATDSASGQSLTFSATGLPPGLSINSSGQITGTPTAAGTSTVKVTATDSTGASGSASFTWTVSGGATGGTCQVSYSTTSQWTGGFTANVTIDNTGASAIDGWSLGFTFPGDQHITNAWNATTTQAGEAVTATNASYNATLAAGGNTSFGFQGTWTNSDAAPTTFTLNGNACT